MKKKKSINKKYYGKSKAKSFLEETVLAAGITGVSLILVKLLPKVSSKLYKESVKKENKSKKDSEWGPVIERIEK